jgi:hypothetical protein
MSQQAVSVVNKLDYVKVEKIFLRDHYDESWLKNKIIEDTTLLGLGELEVIDRERVQSSGGRIDLLLYDRELDTYYEVELMLGRTDESHIIRTIEYWDIESRKSPSKEHIAVIVAEEITNRFFNVIYLINRSIPIIAIQFNAIKFGDKLILNFTKVLDLNEEHEEVPVSRTVDEKEWMRRVEKGEIHPKSYELIKKIVNVLKTHDSQEITLNYTKYYMSLSKYGKGFIFLGCRKTQPMCQIDMRITDEDTEAVKKTLEETSIVFKLKRDNIVSIFLNESDYDKYKDRIDEVILKSKEYY